MKRIRKAKGWIVAASLIAVLAVPGMTWAQETGRITGTVTTDNGRPLSGAIVNLADLNIGALTDSEGGYTLDAVAVGPQTITVRMIGYGEASTSVTVVSGQAVPADLQLSAVAVEMEGVVVVGYGTQTRGAVTSAVGSVDGQELETVPTTNLSNAIGGKLTGVMSVNSSGEPGGDGATLHIRGSHTLNDNSPLITSGGDGTPMREEGELILEHNPHIPYYNSQRGYVRATLTPEQWTSDFRIVPSVTSEGSPIHTDASFVVENGRPGVQRA